MMTATPAPVHPGQYRYDAFPDFPNRDDMQNSLYLAAPSHYAALGWHFGARDTTLTLGEVPIGWHRDQHRGILVPDLIVAFNVDLAAIYAQMGYAVTYHGKAPDFVLEVAAGYPTRDHTAARRRGYAAYGVSEYWRFEHEWGQNYPTGLAGDRLTDGGVYQPITIHRVDANRYWGHSAALNLAVCWEHGQLRWYDAAVERYLPTYAEVCDLREQEQAVRIAATAATAADKAERDAVIKAHDAYVAYAAALQRLSEVEDRIKFHPPADAAP